ncbi:MAG: hypothetical protein OEV41_00175 [Gammaproteobacteria bacterium]|nr:hypothetical protein [Gammaproteobacteria bacterium]MDH5344249.1 hypothetical protein [Gammaproteobacteria bacterium]MDH5621744.1 hypothetical protein [Gammaproteobacteria bacterium]
MKSVFNVLTTSLLLVAMPAWSQGVSESLFQDPVSMGEGWHGFSDVGFLVSATLTLLLAVILGAIIAYHPRHEQTADTLAEIEAPKVYIIYAVIGAIIGIMVVKYGLVVGFVLFGIGGLIRFRTSLRSASLTGRIIFTTLIGLSCGLNLPHVAVLATVFGYVLIYILDASVAYRLDISSLPANHIVEAAAAYRALLEQNDCRIVSEKKALGKKRVTFIFRTSKHTTHRDLQDLLETQIDGSLKGSVNWEID